MKRIILSVLAVVTLFAGYYAHNAQNKVQLAGVVLANVEALADDAGEETQVGTCYLMQNGSSTIDFKIFCDSRTNNTTIYPCPADRGYGGYNDMSKDRCTK